MKKVDVSVAAVTASVRPAQAALLFVIALALVTLSIPFTIAPLVQRWRGSATTAAGEAWPAAPPTYAPPIIGAANDARLSITPTPLPAPVWQELSYLTTVEFTTSTVADEERSVELPIVGYVVSDRMLIKVVGEVQVGIDLSQIRDVQVEGKVIRLTVPQPEVTSVELLPDQSQIYDSLNVFLLSQYPGLESAALEKARQQMRADIANNASMMKLAQEFSRLQLTEFLRKTGFSTVEINFSKDVTGEDFDSED